MRYAVAARDKERKSEKAERKGKKEGRITLSNVVPLAIPATTKAHIHQIYTCTSAHTQTPTRKRAHTAPAQLSHSTQHINTQRL
jgi:hypothetical protein